MFRFLAKRIALTIPTFIALMFLTFLMIRLALVCLVCRVISITRCAPV